MNYEQQHDERRPQQTQQPGEWQSYKLNYWRRRVGRSWQWVGERLHARCGVLNNEPVSSCKELNGMQ